MKKLLLILGLSLGLVGCGVSYEERRKAQISAATDLCVSYGYSRGTSAIAQCIQTETARAEEDRRRRWQAIAEAGEALQGPATTTTNCNAWGNSLNCTSTTW